MQYAVALVNDLMIRLRNRDDGQALVEYGLILGLIAVVCIGALTTMGGDINTLLGKINTALGG